MTKWKSVSYLDAVPKAVTNTGDSWAKNLNGSFLVPKKNRTESVKIPWIAKPSITVTKYKPNLSMRTPRLEAATTFDVTRKKTPIGDSLETSYFIRNY